MTNRVLKKNNKSSLEIAEDVISRIKEPTEEFNKNRNYVVRESGPRNWYRFEYQGETIYSQGYTAYEAVKFYSIFYKKKIEKTRKFDNIKYIADMLEAKEKCQKHNENRKSNTIPEYEFTRQVKRTYKASKMDILAAKAVKVDTNRESIPYEYKRVIHVHTDGFRVPLPPNHYLTNSVREMVKNNKKRFTVGTDKKNSISYNFKVCDVSSTEIIVKDDTLKNKN